MFVRHCSFFPVANFETKVRQFRPKVIRRMQKRLFCPSYAAGLVVNNLLLYCFTATKMLFSCHAIGTQLGRESPYCAVFLPISLLIPLLQKHSNQVP